MLAGGVHLLNTLALDGGAHGGDQAVLDRDVADIRRLPLRHSGAQLRAGQPDVHHRETEGDGAQRTTVRGSRLVERAHRAVNDSPSAEDDVV